MTPAIFARLGALQRAADAALERLSSGRIVERVWARDHTVWAPGPEEIADRLGWLDCPAADDPAAEARALAAALPAAGISHAVVLGMGGSSLAAEVFSSAFSPAGVALSVLDSTAPEAVRALARRCPPKRALFVVATKSGGTVETLSLARFFHRRAVDALGRAAGEHFVAITDPGSRLAGWASQLGFRHTFLNDPELGGRYSALSLFGLVPAALAGVDVSALLARGARMAARCRQQAADNPGARLGAILGGLALAGRDKATVLVSPAIAAFGDWLEQLVAESTGKAGRGILPVVGEPPGPPDAYGADRLFVHLRLAGDGGWDAAVDALHRAGHPVVRVELDDALDLGGQFFLWEFATAAAGHLLGVNPFNQPDVESAKARTREAVEAFRRSGALPAQPPVFEQDALSLFGEVTDQAAGLVGALYAFLGQGAPGDYIALQAYLPPSDGCDAALHALRLALRARFGLAVTVGYGPRFLHSTGQLHKGDRGNGLCLQFTHTPTADLSIPETFSGQAANGDEVANGDTVATLTFATLLAAQAHGDFQALRAAGRRVLRVHLGADPASALARLQRAF